MTEHSKLPWKEGGGVTKTLVISKDNELLGEIYDVDDRAFAIRACNCHDELVAAVKEAMEFAVRQIGSVVCGKSAYKLSEKLRLLIAQTERSAD